jgi:hypothetical protein
MRDFSYYISEHLPENVSALIWDVFFASRKRGVSLPFHFPWIEKPGAFYVVWIELGDQAQVVAALLMKRFLLRNNKPAAMVGLVCVHPKERGKGLSKILLTTASMNAVNLGLKALVLWTQKPSVYESLGYVSVVREQLWNVSVPIKIVKQSNIDLVLEKTIELESGLPPYAFGARIYTLGSANAIVLNTIYGDTVAAWQGQTVDVAMLLFSALSENWLLNALPEDDLPSMLIAMGCKCDCSLGVHRMLGDSRILPMGIDETLSLLPTFRILQRI